MLSSYKLTGTFRRRAAETVQEPHFRIAKLSKILQADYVYQSICMFVGSRPQFLVELIIWPNHFKNMVYLYNRCGKYCSLEFQVATRQY